MAALYRERLAFVRRAIFISFAETAGKSANYAPVHISSFLKYL